MLEYIAQKYEQEILRFSGGKPALQHLVESRDNEIDVRESGRPLKPHMRMIRAALDPDERRAVRDIAFGISPSRVFGAGAWLGPDGERMVVMNYGLMTGLDQGSRSLMTLHGQVFPGVVTITDESELDEMWRPACLAFGRQVLQITSEYGSFASDHSLLDPMKATILRLWIPTVQLYALTHELAHFFLGHAGSEGEVAGSISPAQELEADEWAIGKVLEAGRRRLGVHPMWVDGAACGPAMLLFLKQAQADLFGDLAPTDDETVLTRRASRIVAIIERSCNSQGPGLLKDLYGVRSLWIQYRSEIRAELGYPV